MSQNTKIEWADHTFNPWEGCQKVGPGCDNCYAEARNSRFNGGTPVNWGPGAPRRRTSKANWAQPLRWNANADKFQTAHGRRQRVFCASLADVFDNEVGPWWRADLFELIVATPNLDWLLLTKRIGNAETMISDALDDIMLSPRGWPWPNVWLGATVVNQEEADRDIPKLLAVPAAKRFLSIEPMLGPINLRHLNEDKETWEVDCLAPDTWGKEMSAWASSDEPWEEDFEDHYGVTLKTIDPNLPMHNGIDWVICGGESGPKARPMHPDWVRSLRDQCQAGEVPFFFKQWGEWIEPDIDGMDVRLTARRGDPEFLDAASTMTGFLCVDGRFVNNVVDMQEDVPYLGMRKVGKKAAGRMLDGREWNEVSVNRKFPQK